MTKNTEEDIAFIRALADLLKESDLAEIEVKREYGDDDELKVRLSRTRAAEAAPAMAPYPAAAPPPASAPTPVAAEPEPEAGETVTSPMVGTVYLAPEPGAPPFVEIGARVREGDTLLIIEAMKTMNQIPSPVSGTVRRVLVSNGEPLEFGAPLMIIS